VVQIWPGQTVTYLHTNCPGYIWTTLYTGSASPWFRTILIHSQQGFCHLRAIYINPVISDIQVVTAKRFPHHSSEGRAVFISSNLATCQSNQYLYCTALILRYLCETFLCLRREVILGSKSRDAIDLNFGILWRWVCCQWEACWVSELVWNFWGRQNFWLLLGFEPRAIRPAATPYTDYAIPACTVDLLLVVARRRLTDGRSLVQGSPTDCGVSLGNHVQQEPSTPAMVR
jgi:hypothetical protein